MGKNRNSTGTGRRGPKPKPVALISDNPEAIKNLDPEKLELSEYAIEEWNEIIPYLIKKGLMCELDKTVLALYCESFASWKESNIALKKEGHIMQTKSGYKQRNPWFDIRRQSLADMERMLAEFGLSPSGRAKLGFKGNPLGGDNPFESI